MSTIEPNHALRFQTFEDCITERPKEWLIENVIALGEDSTWFGPPGSLKSALLTDIAVHVASGRDWRGHQFNRGELEYRGVVYFALERAGLTRRRLAAYAARDGLSHDLPIAVISETIDLLDPASVSIVVDTIREFDKTTSHGIGLVIFDTFSKAVAAGDEDKAQTQNLAAAHLKKIRESFDDPFHIGTIGHTGKNPSAGERGSNAKLGHVDLAVQISGDKVRTATVVKGNDQSEGALASFEMEEVTVRDDYTVAILAATTPAKEARTADPQRTTAKHAQALDALRRAIAERGKDGAVHIEFWKEELTRGGLIKLEDKNPRATFARIRNGLSQRIIAEPDNLVRIKLPECPA